jgi:hypothetical protein
MEIPLLSFWQFTFRAFLRAVTDTASFFEWNLKTVLTAATIAVITVFLVYKVRGAEAAKEELSTLVVTALVPTLLFGASLFLFYAFRAPYRVYVEEHAKAATDIATAVSNVRAAEERERLATARALAAEQRISDLNKAAGSAGADLPRAPLPMDAVRAVRVLSQGSDVEGLQFSLAPIARPTSDLSRYALPTIEIENSGNVVVDSISVRAIIKDALNGWRVIPSPEWRQIDGTTTFEWESKKAITPGQRARVPPFAADLRTDVSFSGNLMILVVHYGAQNPKEVHFALAVARPK